MFTGIVGELGVVGSVEATDQGSRITLLAPGTVKGMAVGDSVAVNGVCLTAVVLEGSRITVELVAETLARTNLGQLAAGDPVDLERPMAATGRFDGHVVQGHVDGTGNVVSVSEEGAGRRVRIGLGGSLARYVAEKGSITVDGVSLTVTAVGGGEEPWFEVALIPHTLEVTVLGRRRPGDTVNLEVDVIAKYVERLMGVAG
jgi:riboflavin synthase